jgi:hypothetical protein
MVWLLFINSDKDFETIRITFSNRYNNGNYDRTFYSGDYSDWCDFERAIIEVMNLNVALRDVIYVVCDIRLKVYEYLYDKIETLLKRTSGVIDLQSFIILNKIGVHTGSSPEKIEFFL